MGGTPRHTISVLANQLTVHNRGAWGSPGCTYDIVCKTCQEHGPSTVPDHEYDEVGEDEVQTTRAGGRQGQGELGKPCLSHGESGYSAYHLGLGHREGLEKRRKKNSFWRHSFRYHGGNVAEFALSVTAVHPSQKIKGRNKYCIWRQWHFEQQIGVPLGGCSLHQKTVRAVTDFVYILQTVAEQLWLF